MSRKQVWYLFSPKCLLIGMTMKKMQHMNPVDLGLIAHTLKQTKDMFSWSCRDVP